MHRLLLEDERLAVDRDGVDLNKSVLCYQIRRPECDRHKTFLL